MHSLFTSFSVFSFFLTKNHSLQLDGFSCYCRAITNSIYILHYIFVSHFSSVLSLLYISALHNGSWVQVPHSYTPTTPTPHNREKKVKKKSVKMLTTMWKWTKSYLNSSIKIQTCFVYGWVYWNRSRNRNTPRVKKWEYILLQGKQTRQNEMGRGKSTTSIELRLWDNEC